MTKTLQNCLVCACGSRGDIQPAIVFAKEISAIYNVTMITPLDFQKWIQSEGINHVSVGSFDMLTDSKLVDALIDGKNDKIMESLFESWGKSISDLETFMKVIEQLSPSAWVDMS